MAAKDKAAAQANARGLKAANKPTRASKTFVGNNENMSVEARRRALKNMPPARPNRVRGGSLNTLRRQGKTKSVPRGRGGGGIVGAFGIKNK